MKEKLVLKVVEWSMNYGISVGYARGLNEEEKKIYREDILIGIGEFIKLEHINWRQLFNVIDKDQYIGEFLGCSNMVYRITEEQERRLIELNNQKAREKENVQKEEIEEAINIVNKVDEKKVKMLPRKDIRNYLNDYNDLHNEGGEGYLPDVIAEEDYIAAKKLLERI